MDDSVAAANKKSPGEERALDSIEKLLADSKLTATDVRNFFVGKFDKIDAINNSTVDYLELKAYKPEDEKEASIIGFLLESQSQLAKFSDDETLNERHLTINDIEQFNLKYNGTYARNLDRLVELRRRFVSSLPDLDTDGNGVLSKPELKEAAGKSTLSESSRGFAGFLHSEFEQLASTYGRTKRSSGIRAIGRYDFDMMLSRYDFDATRNSVLRFSGNYLNSTNASRMKIANWLESASRQGIFETGR